MVTTVTVATAPPTTAAPSRSATIGTDTTTSATRSGTFTIIGISAGGFAGVSTLGALIQPPIVQNYSHTFYEKRFRFLNEKRDFSQFTDLRISLQAPLQRLSACTAATTSYTTGILSSRCECHEHPTTLSSRRS